MDHAELRLSYVHVDVFAARAYAGNSLPVFVDSRGLTGEQMLSISQELRHFEAIFLEPTLTPKCYKARIFDLFEELPFAGHPIIGAAAVLHNASLSVQEQLWTFKLAERTVTVITNPTTVGYSGLLDQGRVEFLGEVEERGKVAEAFNLTVEDLDDRLPLAVVSTGLRYLIVPVRPDALPRVKINADITVLLQALGAQFAVLLDEANLEIRHWNNDGIMEDIATGSAAGTIGAFLLRHGSAQNGEFFVLKQGRFAGRPSEITVQAHGTPDKVTSVKVGGDVVLVGRGTLEVIP